MKKKKWTLQELISEIGSIGNNPYARHAIEYEFPLLAITNAAGELVYEDKHRIDAYSLAMNLLAYHMERFFRNFLSQNGSDMEDFWNDNHDEFHRLLTGIFDGIYGMKGVRKKNQQKK